MMDEDALSYNSASALTHVLLQFEYSKTNSVLLVKGNFNGVSAKVKMHLIIYNDDSATSLLSNTILTKLQKPHKREFMPIFTYTYFNIFPLAPMAPTHPPAYRWLEFILESLQGTEQGDNQLSVPKIGPMAQKSGFPQFL